MLLQVAAGNRLREDTAALNMTYTASVTAVETATPSANHGSKCATFALLFGIGSPLVHCAGPYRPVNPQTLSVADGAHGAKQPVEATRDVPRQCNRPLPRRWLRLGELNMSPERRNQHGRHRMG
jgi:hypothetical protein